MKIKISVISGRYLTENFILPEIREIKLGKIKKEESKIFSNGKISATIRKILHRKENNNFALLIIPAEQITSSIFDIKLFSDFITVFPVNSGNELKEALLFVLRNIANKSWVYIRPTKKVEQKVRQVIQEKEEDIFPENFQPEERIINSGSTKWGRRASVRIDWNYFSDIAKEAEKLSQLSPLERRLKKEGTIGLQNNIILSEYGQEGIDYILEK